MPVTPYLSFEGRCEQALEFYKKALGAEVTMLLRFKDSPEGPPPEGAGSADKVMHCTFKIGGTELMASDGYCTGNAKFGGISLSYAVPTPEDANRVFAALAEGGQVHQPLVSTFFSPKFGVVADKFGVTWMLLVQQ